MYNLEGKIKKLNHIVVSDPMYDKDVWCRYELDNLKENNWYVLLKVFPRKISYKTSSFGLCEFSLLLTKHRQDAILKENGDLAYNGKNNLKYFSIGMDSACIALGVNDKAKIINDSKEDWQPACAIRTGGDGVFGEVVEGKRDNKLNFILITGDIDEEFITEKELMQYLVDQFEIIEIKEIKNKLDNNINEEIITLDKDEREI